MDGRRCARCGVLYPPHLVERTFRPRRSVRDASCTNYRTSVCRPCEQTARDAKKLNNRWAVKARDVIRRHAARFEISKEDLVERYGWDPKRLAHDAEHQYGNGCNYCGEQYQAMGHGLGDITLDVMDRDRSPYYRTNTKWCCQTCNRKKGAMAPEDFELDRQVYEVWRRWRDQPPENRGFLF